MLKLLCGWIDDPLLKSVIENNSTIYQELRSIIEAQNIPSEMSPALHEVFLLYRWTSPRTKEEHIFRAFSCLMLLTLNENTTYDYEGDEISSGILLNSILHINTKLHTPTLQFITWKIIDCYQKETVEDDEIVSIAEVYINDFFLLALIYLQVLNQVDEKLIKGSISTLVKSICPSKNIVDEAIPLKQLLLQSKSLIKPSIWLENSILSLADTNFIKNEKVQSIFESIHEFAMNEKNDI